MTILHCKMQSGPTIVVLCVNRTARLQQSNERLEITANRRVVQRDAAILVNSRSRFSFGLFTGHGVRSGLTTQAQRPGASILHSPDLIGTEDGQTHRLQSRFGIGIRWSALLGGSALITSSESKPMTGQCPTCEARRCKKCDQPEEPCKPR